MLNFHLNFQHFEYFTILSLMLFQKPMDSIYRVHDSREPKDEIKLHLNNIQIML